MRPVFTLLYVCFCIFFIAPCCWPFLFIFFLSQPFLGLSSDNPSNLAVVFLVFCKLRVSLSQIFSVISRLSDHVSSPFHPAFNYFANYASIMACLHERFAAHLSAVNLTADEARHKLTMCLDNHRSVTGPTSK